jgi:hypothetical protein
MVIREKDDIKSIAIYVRSIFLSNLPRPYDFANVGNSWMYEI